MRASAKSLRILGPMFLTGSLLALGCGDDDKPSLGSDDASATAVSPRDASLGRDAAPPGTGPSLLMDASVRMDSAVLPTIEDSGITDSGEISLTDSQIAAVLVAINQGEINEGKLASNKAEKADVQAYAKQMVDMHTKASTDAATLFQKLGITPAPSAVATVLTGNASSELEVLNKEAPGQEFDLDYIEDQAAAHKVALELIDMKLTPQADAPELQAFLEQTHYTVSMHLASANALLDTLRGDASIRDAN